MSKGWSKVSAERYARVKPGVDAIKGKIPEEIASSWEMTGQTAERIRSSADYADYKETLRVRLEQRRAQGKMPTINVPEVFAEQPAMWDESRSSAEKLDYIISIVSRIKPKYLEKEK